MTSTEIQQVYTLTKQSVPVHTPKPNLNKAEAQAIRELKRDKLVLTADKGVAMVIIDRQDYINKSNKLFNSISLQGYPQGPHKQNKS